MTDNNDGTKIMVDIAFFSGMITVVITLTNDVVSTGATRAVILMIPLLLVLLVIRDKITKKSR